MATMISSQHSAPNGGGNSPRMRKLRPREAPFWVGQGSSQRARQQLCLLLLPCLWGPTPSHLHPCILTENWDNTQAGAGADPGPGIE